MYVFCALLHVFIQFVISREREKQSCYLNPQFCFVNKQSAWTNLYENQYRWFSNPALRLRATARTCGRAWYEICLLFYLSITIVHAYVVAHATSTVQPVSA